ncbi:MAG: trypsin-like peptidase domain-containing protein [Candidatus Zixiibacteriota bacterium]|nr:MAG: trypsin-like peptidase domain-containing protein [candidate division Zixibacteria bacterium]
MKGMFIFLTGLLLLAGSSAGQVSKGGRPVSFQKKTAASVPQAVMPAVDVAALLSEDIEEQRMGLPLRFGYPHEVDYDLTNSGVWEELDDGGRLWRLEIRCPGAFSVNLIYERFRLPHDAEFFVYSKDTSTVLGAFTRDNNKPHGQFATAPVRGDVCVLEYYLPPGADEVGEIKVERVVHGYRNIFFSRAGAKEVLDFGNSGECNINVNCPEGDLWRDDIRAVAMILTAGGYRICSGSLINNVREDLTPFFLTAHHCLGDEETWIIMFNYESPSCDDIDGPTWMTVQGTTLLAFYNYSDFALLELSEAPPDSYNVYYAGWSAVDTAADSAVAIHHPSGDIKKISFDFDPLTSTDYFTTSGESHWRVGEWELGTTEPGSSGSPLFNWDHHIVGQLHGGYASCQVIRADWYGKFSKSWDYGGTPESRLVDWLDPDNTGTLAIDGTDLGGLSFSADPTIGWVPLAVNFTGSSVMEIDEWIWDFGDGDSAFVQSPPHVYDEPGPFDVSLEVHAGEVVKRRSYQNYITVLADTLIGSDAVGDIDSPVEVVIYARNWFPLDYIRIPVEFGGELPLSFDSISTDGCRTDYFATQDLLHWDPFNNRMTLRLKTGFGQPELEPGAGDIIKLYFTIGASGELGQSTTIELDGYEPYDCRFYGSIIDYAPFIISGSVTADVGCCLNMGDIDHSQQVDALDITYFADWIWVPGSAAPPCDDEVNVNGDNQGDALDLIYLAEYIFQGMHDPLPPCP